MPSTLLIGGARSGKSALAVEMGARAAASGREVVFVATATAVDDDMAARIDHHRAERPPWPTIEEPHDLGAAIAATPRRAFVIVDCLTVWVANLLWRGDDDASVERAAAAAARPSPDRDIVAVTNEVGLGVHPGNELGRRYRDLLGRVNHAWAAASDRTLLLVAGRALPLADPWTLLAPTREVTT